MRELTDIVGTSMRVERISGRNAFEGMLEGTPFTNRLRRLQVATKQMERRGNYVHGLPELEAEIEATKGLSFHQQVWAPAEEWTARLVGQEDFRGKTRNFVNICWWQEGGDPMARLAEIVLSIDLSRYAASEHFDYD